MENRAQVFISYANEDYDAAKRLFDALRRVPGLVPWLDKESLLPGMNWEHGIMLALEESAFAVPLLSGRSTTKRGFVQREFRRILEKLETVPEGRIAVIPARLEDCMPPSLPLQKIQWVDLFPDWDRGVERMIAAIRHEQALAHESVTPTIRAVARMANLQPTPEIRLTRSQAEKVVASDKDLSAVNLMSCNLSQLDLRSSLLRGANLVGVDLSGADLRGAVLVGANLERARLTGTRLGGADLWGANLWRANLHGVLELADASSLEYTNFFGVMGLRRRDRMVVERANTTDLPDYGSFVSFFRRNLEMSMDEVRAVFAWLNHEYFQSMFGREA